MTQRFAVLGAPIAHSLSPRLHRAAFAAMGRDATYEAIEVDAADFSAVLARLRAAGFAGVNLTAPLKPLGLAAADEATPAACAAGAANTLAFRAGIVAADNTDGAGFMAFLARAGVPVAGRAIAFLGGGGAVRGLVPALLGQGAGPIAVVVRAPERAAADFAPFLARGLSVVARDEAPDGPAARAVRAAALVVQGTPLGLSAGDALPCPPAWPGPQAVAVDLLYHPPVTPWLAALRARGVRAANGLGLLIEQALLAQRFWFGVEPPRSALEEAVRWRDPFAPSPASSGEAPGR
jgi:shikimate dehydrogenase